MKHINPQVEQMTPFIVMDVLERAKELEREGVSIIHLEVGEPDFDTPACVLQAAKLSLDNQCTHYTHSLGDVQLRKEIARFYKDEYDVTVDPECIVVTSGSSPAILLALMLLCEADCEVILSNPGMPVTVFSCWLFRPIVYWYRCAKEWSTTWTISVSPSHRAHGLSL
jgi:aspartate/methionine/tyrosine aminotransferase